MVTKPSRYQTRRTNTAGKVFSASELLNYELGLNAVDRKLYSKDAGGNVFQVAASPGRNPGNALVYESFLGSDLQGLSVKNDGRIWIKHDKDKISDYATLQVTRTIDPDATGDNVQGLTSAAVLISTEIKKSGVTTFQWPLTVLLTYDPADGQASPNSEHVVIFGGGTKKANAGMWGANIGVSDQVANPNTATIGFELTMGAKGLDPNNQRFGLLLAFGSAPANQGGTNEVTYGITFGAPPSQCLLKAAINFDCAAYTALNFTTMSNTRGQSVMKIKPGYNIEWADSLFSSIQARFGFDGTAFDLGGVVTTASATAGAASALPVAPAFYSTIKINGSYIKIPCYPL
jgi:hypothetical protein